MGHPGEAGFEGGNLNVIDNSKKDHYRTAARASLAAEERQAVSAADHEPSIHRDA